MPDWDSDSVQLSANLKTLLLALRDSATERGSIYVEASLEWHRHIMRGLSVPDPLFVGRFRGSEGLERIGVRIGDHEGVAPDEVADELMTLQRKLDAALQYLDEIVPKNAELSEEPLGAIIDVCAFVHAEWVRIHPFANGNGRTARLWANVIAMRYGLPPFVRLRPRPAGDEYASASSSAMVGNWKATSVLFRQMLNRFLDQKP